MYSARRLSFAIGTLIFFTLIGLVIFGSKSFQRDVQALQTAGQEDISWSTSQLELELMRFRAEMTALDSPAQNPAVSPATLNNRFDILWSRVAIFHRGRVGERLMTYDSETRVVGRLFATMQAFETRIITLQPGDSETIAAVQNAFAPFGDELREFSRRVTLGEQKISADIRAQLRSGAQRTIFILAAATVLLVIALIVIWRDAIRNQRLALRNEQLAKAAMTASMAKSQFLTMMSHELRTPMNGVLGLLALAQQSDIDAPLRRTLSQAERSATRMIGLLTDILDFSALQSETLALERKPFSIMALAARLRKDGQADTKSLRVTVETPDIAPLLGDEQRLNQIYGHMTGYLMETAGVGAVSLALSYDASVLRAKIGFNYADGGQWNPELLGESGTQDASNFVTGAVGPTIARALCAQMGGQITICADRGDGGEVIIDIPLAAEQVSTVSLRLVTQTAMVEKMCRIALSDPGIAVLPPESECIPKVVLIETTGTGDEEKYAELRAAYPDAILVGLALNCDNTPYDQCLKLPVDIAELRATILGYRDAGE